MASAATQTYLAPAEYLAWERKADTKHEYRSGHIVAMASANYRHTLITTNISGELYIQLKGRACTVHTNDMRVKTSPIVSYFYPDVVVICEKPRFEDNTFDTLLNPTLLVEVLSPSTEAYDSGEKFARYPQFVCLQGYVLVSQDRVHVEHYLRQGAHWVLTELRSLADVLTLTSIECELPLRDIYTGVEFSE